MLRQVEHTGRRRLRVDVDQVQVLWIIAAQEIADLLPLELKDPPGPEIEPGVAEWQEMEASQPFRQVVHPVEADQCGVETRVAIEMLLQKAEMRLVPHAVFDKEEGSGGACGCCGRRQFLDLRSHSTPPSKVGLRFVGCHRQRGSASGHTQRPRLARDRKPLLILVISTEARKRPAHYTPKAPQVVRFVAKSRGTEWGETRSGLTLVVYPGGLTRRI